MVEIIPKSTGAYSDKILGNVKASTGSLLGDKTMQAQGNVQIAKGDAEIQVADAKRAADASADKITGGLKQAAGYALGNDVQRAEGKAQSALGDSKMPSK